jgi:hypothetical protein
VLHRIPNPDALSGTSAGSSGSTSGPAAADASRRGDDRRATGEADARERAARFKAALQQRAQHEGQAAGTRPDPQGARSAEPGRDRAAAAEVMGRLGLDGEGGPGRASGGRAGGTDGAAVGGVGEAAAVDATGATAGAPGTAPEAAGRGARDAAVDVGAEVNVIERAIDKVIGRDDKGPDAANLGAEDVPMPGLTPWQRPEGPARPEAPRQLPSPPPGTEAYHRLLMGQGPAGAEARLTITQGPLAGLQIHLTNGPGGVQAAVLTQGASSRQTLVSAMDQVAQRLRQKGHTLDLRFGAAGGARGPSGRRG